MKYIKIAILSILGTSFLFSCQKENTNFGPGTGVVEFSETTVHVTEASSIFTVPLVLSGEPGGYPVTVTVSADTDGNIDDILLISSTTIKITEANNSYLQMIPVFNRQENLDHEVRLTIESCNGASIGSNNSCTIIIENSAAVQTGQYIVYSSNGLPEEWTLLLQEGPGGTYIASNFFNGDFSPRLVGTFNEETSQLIFDGQIYGQGATPMFFYPMPMSNGNYMVIISGEGDDPLIFNVDEDMYLSNSTSYLQISELYVDGDQLVFVDTPLGVMGGRTTFEYAGSALDEEWPF